MSSSDKFVDALRRRTRVAYLNSSIWQSLFALGLVTIGWSLGGWGYLTAMIGIAWIVFVIRGVIKRRTPTGDPLDIQLSKHGTPEAIASELEKEFAGQTFRPHQIYVGQRWLCYSWKKQVTICKIDTLVWAYWERIRHSVNFVPTGTTHQLVAWSRDGRGVALPLRKKKDVELALEALHRAAPWVFVGFTEALKESWNSDREDLIALVDEARQQSQAILKIK
jgi:hypothetical protein